MGCCGSERARQCAEKVFTSDGQCAVHCDEPGKAWESNKEKELDEEDLSSEGGQIVT